MKEDIVKPDMKISGPAQGVSATHLDWTMVPYVRKSFYKHYKDGMRYINGNENFVLSDRDVISTDIENLDIYDCAPAYKYAYDQTKKEVHQAVEGMFHNLK